MTLSYGEAIGLVAERSAVLRSAVAGVLSAPVPGCPDWTGRDLVAHLGGVQRFWAAIVAAGPADGPPDDGDVPDHEPSGDLLEWSERGTDALVAALRSAEPDRAVWTWWKQPRTAAAVARHQVQEATVHAWDALDTAGRANGLPAAVALDGVDEFLCVELPVAATWPHADATVALVADEVADTPWRVVLADGVGRVERTAGTADAELRGPASALVLALYGRRGPSSVTVSGDRDLAVRLLDWFVTE